MRTEDIPPHWRKLPEKQALTGGGTPWCALQGHFSYMIGILPEIHFQQLFESYLIKKVYKWRGCAKTHYSIYFARTVCKNQCEQGLSKLSCMYCFCRCLSLHQSLRQKEGKHSGWAALVVKAVAKKGSLLTHSSTEVPEQVILSSHYESNYSESESGQILSSNICIWHNRAGKKWGERYTFWYIVLLTILERRKSMVQCIPTCNLT